MLNTWRALKLVWQSSPPFTLALGSITFAGGFPPAARVWASKLIIDAVVKAMGSPGEDKGSHEELLERGRRYVQLFNIQAEGYR